LAAVDAILGRLVLLLAAWLQRQQGWWAAIFLGAAWSADAKLGI